jgi:hypothetical protein
LVLDGLVALLMFATIVFCFRLNRRLASLRGVQAEMKGLVASFVAATERAELGVARLRAAAEETGDTLQERLEGARAVADELAFLSETGTRLAERLEAGVTNRRSRPETAGAVGSTAPSRRSFAASPSGAGRPEAPTLAERELIDTLRRARPASAPERAHPDAAV